MEKRLRRSRKDRILFGVLGGIAEYFDLDPTLVRLFFILLFVFYPVQMTLLYLLAAFVIPEEKNGEESDDFIDEASRKLREGSGNLKLLAIVLIAFGLVLLMRPIVPVTIDRTTAVALGLLILGVLLLLRGD
ncbi:PspC domain-containing protein [Thermococcus sp.]|uniref:PspC domain-containing protein n=1 Tax=Thermococcus sp. TaxID=35749 RepID=UPI002609BD0A|nr:PspC domain-containing protein [Thermococcus sp.]